MFNDLFYALADTGSPVTIVSYDLIPKDLLSTISPVQTNLIGANGSSLDVVGKLPIDFYFPTHFKSKFNCSAIIAKNVCENILLGSDFLSDNNCVLDFSNLTMTVNNFSIPLLKIDSNTSRNKTFKVNITKTIVIPPHTKVDNVQCSLKCKRKKISSYHTFSGIVTPAENLLSKKFGISSPSFLTNFNKGKGYIQISNTNDFPITLYRNQTFGILEKLQQHTVNHLQESLLQYQNSIHVNSVHDDDIKPSNQDTSTPDSLNNVKLNNLFDKLKIQEMTHLSSEQKFELKDLITKYQHIFYDEDKGLPAANLPEHEIVLDTDKPLRTPYRQIPLALKPHAVKLIQDMMDKDIIEPARSSPYHSPAFVIKRNNKFRVIVDYRLVNSHVIRNYQPLPSIDNITSMWSGCKYWSSIDLHSAYFQINLSKKSRPITAASIPGVSYFQFKRVPLGISSAVGYFQGLIESTLLGVNCVNYMDDIATGAVSFSSMMQNIESIFQRLSEVGLLLKPEKTKLFQKQMTYLGYMLNESGVQVDPSKTDAVTKMCVPKNKKQVRSFVGFCSFYRKFIKGYSDIVKPLTNLFQKDVKFVWGESQQIAFDTIRQKLVEAPILQYPNLDKKFYLTCDASSTGIACVLQQESDHDHKTLLPIAFASNVLTATQQKWSTFQRELYAMKFYCSKFKHFLLGKKFTIRTDNMAVVHWSTFKEFDNPKLWRWFVSLSQFDFDVVHIPSSKNESDGPSRIGRSNDPLTNEPSDSNYEQQVNFVKNNPITKSQVSLIDIDKLKAAQDADYTLNEVILWVKAGKKPELDRKVQKFSPDKKVYYNSFNRLKLKDGILFRSWERLDNEMPDDLICIPKSMTEDIIKICHDLPSGGHLGKPKTLAKLQSRFYWPKMSLQVSLYIDACTTCLKKSQRIKPKSPLQPFNGTSPNDIMQFDLLENMPSNPQSFRSILVMVDRFTGWVEAVPLRDTKAPTIAKAILNHWVASHGVPIQTHSDRGPQFTSEVMNIVFQLIGVHQTFTCAYRPMSDGAAEAMVKVVKNLLKGFCMENPTKWPDLLQQCLFAYRTSKNGSTGYSPFFLHRGHACRIPMDILLKTFNVKRFSNRAEYAYDLYKTLSQTYDFVEQHLNKNREFMKTSYDKRSRVTPYKVGDFVYVWRPRPPHNKNKFFNHYFGPFKIVKLITDYTYKIDVGSKSRMHDIVPHDLLRLASSPRDSENKDRIEYDPIDLDLEHRLEIIPEENEPEGSTTRNGDLTDDRPVIMMDFQQNVQLQPPIARHNMQLRDRNNLQRPDRFQ